MEIFSGTILHSLIIRDDNKGSAAITPGPGQNPSSMLANNGLSDEPVVVKYKVTITTGFSHDS